MKQKAYALWKDRKKQWLLLILSGLLLTISPQLLAQRGKAVIKEYWGEEAGKRFPGAIYYKEKEGTPFPGFVRFDESARPAMSSFFSRLREQIESNTQLDFKLIKQESDHLGFSHARYVQTFQGLDVEHTTYILHVKEQRVHSFNGFAVNIEQQLSPKTDMNEAAALEMAMRAMGAERYKWQDPAWEREIKARTKDPNATYRPKGELLWLQNGRTFSLAYRFDMQAASPDKFERIYVDAHSGVLLRRLPMESDCDGATVNTIFNGNRSISTEKYTANDFRLRDDCQSATIHIRDWNSATCTESPLEIQNTTNTWTTTNERFGAHVLWAAKQCYLYWLNARGRASYDNANGDLDGYINAVFDGSDAAGCQAYTDNASMSFSGGRMKVGLGSSGTLANSWSTLDIIGHEYAHAVTGSSAGLVYQDESGALNESFSDIFGEAVENYVLGSNDWLMGDERTSGAIRSMSNPNAFGDPDTYQGTNWFFGAGDNGGVHTNSGVQNFWFFLLVNGGVGTNDNGDAYSVSGIGLAAASAIAARNLTFYLTANDGYAEARTNAIQAAIDLYGACSNEVKQTTNAWYAVGVGNPAFDVVGVVSSNYNGRDVSCFNACDGAASANVINGFSPIYSWSTGATTPSISGLCPGVYNVTVTNLFGLGCSENATVVIENTPALNVNPAVTTNFNGYGVSCNGEDDGQANANPSGGTPPYNYSWSNGQTTNPAVNLSAGNYSVTVSDINGCEASGNVVVTEPPLLTTTAAATSDYNGYNIRCHGGSDGTAEAYPVGGVAPYTYLWSNGSTENPATGLSAGTYTVTITDANGCTASAEVTLTEPPPLTIDAGENKIVYFGYPDSACTSLTATGIGGGVPPYNIEWSTGSNSETIEVCPEVTTVYTVTLTDLNGCTLSDDVTVCAIDVRCGNKLDKVIVCHKTGSAKNPYQTLCISLSGAQNHFAQHATDELAECGIVKICEDEMSKTPTTFTTVFDKPEQLYLNAFPNPTEGNATIMFSNFRQGRGEIKLLDILGREHQLLFSGVMEAGKIYQVHVDGNALSKGVYFVRFQTSNGELVTQKLVITR